MTLFICSTTTTTGAGSTVNYYENNQSWSPLGTNRVIRSYAGSTSNVAEVLTFSNNSSAPSTGALAVLGTNNARSVSGTMVGHLTDNSKALYFHNCGRYAHFLTINGSGTITTYGYQEFIADVAWGSTPRSLFRMISSNTLLCVYWNSTAMMKKTYAVDWDNQTLTLVSSESISTSLPTRSTLVPIYNSDKYMLTCSDIYILDSSGAIVSTYTASQVNSWGGYSVHEIVPTSETTMIGVKKSDGAFIYVENGVSLSPTPVLSSYGNAMRSIGNYTHLIPIDKYSVIAYIVGSASVTAFNFRMPAASIVQCSTGNTGINISNISSTASFETGNLVTDLGVPTWVRRNDNSFLIWYWGATSNSTYRLRCKMMYI